MNIWIVAKRQHETYGHGSFGESWKLPTTGPYDTGKPHPAFTSEAECMNYIKMLKLYGCVPLAIDVKFKD